MAAYGVTDARAARPRWSRYPLGVASGDPLPDSVVLWTRLAPDPLSLDPVDARRVPVRWELARDAAFRRPTQRGRTWATPELGHSVHVEPPCAGRRRRRRRCPRSIVRSPAAGRGRLPGDVRLRGLRIVAQEEFAQRLQGDRITHDIVFSTGMSRSAGAVRPPRPSRVLLDRQTSLDLGVDR